MPWSRTARTVVGVILAVSCVALGSTGTAGAAGQELWAVRYGMHGQTDDYPLSVAVSPDDSRVFVAGESFGSTTYDGDLVAYAAGTGQRLWAAHTRSGRFDALTHVVVDPSGTRVYAVGYRQQTDSETSPSRFVVFAFDAATGARLWSATAGSGDGGHDTGDVDGAAISPDGTQLYVTGTTGTTRVTALTIAYNAANGVVEWSRHNAGPAGTGFEPAGIVVSPDSGRVVIAGTPLASSVFTESGLAAVAYSASGDRLWNAALTTRGGGYLAAIAMSPDGANVALTGSVAQGPTQSYVTVLVNAVTGTRTWIARYIGPAEGRDVSNGVTFGADSNQVFVTGDSVGAGPDNTDIATVAYDVATGAQQWVNRYDGPAGGFDGGTAVAATNDGSRVIVTGGSATATSSDIATLSLSPTDGTTQWVDRTATVTHPGSIPSALAVSDDSSRAFVAGQECESCANPEILTVAYTVGP